MPVLGNGDIWQAADALAMMAATGCDGVVVGRGCLGRPWLFRDLALACAGRPVPAAPRLGEVAAVLRRHARLLAEWLTEPRGGADVRKHVGWYLQGYPVGGEVRRRLTATQTIARPGGRARPPRPGPGHPAGRRRPAPGQVLRPVPAWPCPRAGSTARTTRPPSWPTTWRRSAGASDLSR